MPRPRGIRGYNVAMNGAASALTNSECQALLRVARDSIINGLRCGQPLAVNEADHGKSLRVPRATFVTLQLHGALRGCIGTLEAVRPLVCDVALNAFAAAFRDPRFTPVDHAEEPLLEIHISILSPPESMRFESQADLLRQLRRGIDGLILQYQQRRGTFLPAVWESLPEPQAFLAHLKVKAGLSPDFWSNEIRIWRYTAELVS